METPRQLFDTRVNVFLGDTASPSPTAFAAKPLNALAVARARGGTGSETQPATRCRTEYQGPSSYVENGLIDLFEKVLSYGNFDVGTLVGQAPEPAAGPPEKSPSRQMNTDISLATMIFSSGRQHGYRCRVHGGRTSSSIAKRGPAFRAPKSWKTRSLPMATKRSRLVATSRATSTACSRMVASANTPTSRIPCRRTSEKGFGAAS